MKILNNSGYKLDQILLDKILELNRVKDFNEEVAETCAKGNCLRSCELEMTSAKMVSGYYGTALHVDYTLRAEFDTFEKKYSNTAAFGVSEKQTGEENRAIKKVQDEILRDEEKKKAENEAERAAKKAKEAEDEAEEKAKASKNDLAESLWLEKHGSLHLRRLFKEGFEYKSVLEAEIDAKCAAPLIAQGWVLGYAPEDCATEVKEPSINVLENYVDAKRDLENYTLKKPTSLLCVEDAEDFEDGYYVEALIKIDEACPCAAVLPFTPARGFYVTKKIF